MNSFPLNRRIRQFMLIASLLAAALVVPIAAGADPIPPQGTDWPMCGTGGDTDGRYCIESLTKNGSPIVVPGAGFYEQPYIDLIGAGDVRFGVLHEAFDHASSTGNVPASDIYDITVNTGAIVPHELSGQIRNVTYSTGGSASAGYTFRMSFQPTPVAMLLAAPGCIIDACGNDTTMSDTDYDGFVTGYVTDLATSGLGSAEIAQRNGYVHTASAQDASMPMYDAHTNTLLIRMANTHLNSLGGPVMGSYQTFLPNAMLTGLMNVPNPSSLTGGSFAVSRTAVASTTTVPFTLTHTSAGISISISGITFSSPTYRIRVRHTVPGAPRMRSVQRIGSHEVRVKFLAPLATGGWPITRYLVRCTRSGKVYRASSTGRNIIVRAVARRRVSCTVRARNAIGIGKPSVARRA